MSSVSITNASASKTEHRPPTSTQANTFLVLAPVASPTYPVNPPTYSQKPASPLVSPIEERTPHVEWYMPELASSPIGEADPTAEEIKAQLFRERRRSSSASSSSGSRRVFLKLGPVHFGGEPGVPDVSQAEEV